MKVKQLGHGALRVDSMKIDKRKAWKYPRTTKTEMRRKKKVVRRKPIRREPEPDRERGE